MKQDRKIAVLYYITLALLMLGLGCSDAVRGVFAPVFQEHYALRTTEISAMMTVSYIGNLVFMLIGSRLSDRFGIGRVFRGALAGWMAALAVYLVTDNYIALLVGVFCAMGASTLLNMLMNLMSPLLFAAPGMIINTLFFVQEIGTTFTQGVIGSVAESISIWKLVNAGLLVIGAAAMVLFTWLSRKDVRLQHAGTAAPAGETDGAQAVQGTSGVYAELLRTPALWLFVLIFGFYFIGEHGVMNWMNLYCRDGLGMSAARASLMPSLFFCGMMAGRLLLAPLVGRLGIRRTLLIFLVAGTVIYVIALLGGGSAMLLLLPAGFGLSIIYPTMTMCIQLYFRQEVAATASGTIMSIGTLFDILFNALFGSVIDRIGYQASMRFLPVSMVICCVIYLVLYLRVRTIRSL